MFCLIHKKVSKTIDFSLDFWTTCVIIKAWTTSVILGSPAVKKIPKISESEWQVMMVLWKKTPSTARDIVNALSEKTLWKPKTIQTLIMRLVAKNAIRYEKIGRLHHYYPRLSQAECVRAETKTFLRRVYDGGLKPMFAAFLEDEKHSPQDHAELKRLVDAKAKE